MLSRLLTRREQFVLSGLAVAVLVGAGVLYFHARGAASEGSQHSLTMQDLAPATEREDAPRDTPEDDTLSDDGAAPEEPTSPTVQVARLEDPAASERPHGTHSPEKVIVSVVGAVHSPGVYTLDADARVHDLVEKAGGAHRSADLSDINLAAPLVDGTTLAIPAKPEARPGKGPVVIGRSSRPAVQNPACYTVSGWRLQSATQASPGTAAPAHAGDTRRLIDLNHATAEQLESLPGIGEKLAGQIIHYRAQAPFQSVDDVQNVSGIGAKRLEAIRPFVCVNLPR